MYRRCVVDLLSPTSSIQTTLQVRNNNCIPDLLAVLLCCCVALQFGILAHLVRYLVPRKRSDVSSPGIASSYPGRLRAVRCSAQAVAASIRLAALCTPILFDASSNPRAAHSRGCYTRKSSASAPPACDLCACFEPQRLARTAAKHMFACRPSLLVPVCERRHAPRGHRPPSRPLNPERHGDRMRPFLAELRQG